jgi:hypothetical protein
VVATDGEISSSRLSLFKVTKAADGSATIQNPGKNVTVPSFSIPANAPQSETTNVLDTFDARLTQSVSAIDPARGTSGKVALWTQHTVAGGAGAMVRWYELNPVKRTVFSTGTLSDSALYEFNGAISPDRLVSGSTRKFGQNMVLSYNTSSATTFPDIRMVGKRGANGVSAPVVVQSSPGPDIDFACPNPINSNVCRWGDYAAATPDPAAPTNATTGRVWLTGMWTLDGNTTGGTSGTSWRSWNWEAKP